jgi:hypothetical protein
VKRLLRRREPKPGEAYDHGAKYDSALQPGQVGTDTGVNSIAKSNVIIRMARNIKAVRGMKLHGVTIRTTD